MARLGCAGSGRHVLPDLHVAWSGLGLGWCQAFPSMVLGLCCGSNSTGGSGTGRGPGATANFWVPETLLPVPRLPSLRAIDESTGIDQLVTIVLESSNTGLYKSLQNITIVGMYLCYFTLFFYIFPIFNYILGSLQ